MKGFPDLPPLWWAGSLALIYAGKWLLPDVHLQANVLEMLSWLFFMAALGLIVWSALWFWRKRTPIEPHHTPRTLIIEGPYRITRNPIYLALVTLTLASAIGHGSLIGLGAAAGLWWVLDRRFAAPEETMLRTAFGAEAERYLAATRRWM